MLRRVSVIFYILALLWIVFLLDNYVFNQQLYQYGIMPKNLRGLRGIIFAPFLHGSLQHIVSNSLPFVIFASLIMMVSPKEFMRVSFICIFVAGLGVWFTAAVNSLHIGASGLVFGYFGFLLTYGWYRKKFLPFVLSLLVGFTFGGLIWGVFPSEQHHISWQGHLFGFLGGIYAAEGTALKKQGKRAA